MSDPSLNDQPLIAHLIELRDRLIRILVVILIFFLGFIAFANDLYAYLAEPLQSLLPEGASMIATQVASPCHVAAGMRPCLSSTTSRPQRVAHSPPP